MSILGKINQDKKKEVEAHLGWVTEDLLEPRERDLRRPKDFLGAIQRPGLSVIAEVKKASPSKGLIRPDFNPVAIALAYAQNQAACLSVLTERSYFGGRPEDLVAIRKVVGLPILRKDFIIDPRQIRESYEMGADAILLIVASLTDGDLGYFYSLAKAFGLTVLVEVHDEKELERALKLEAELIGVNNRSLVTFETHLENSLRLKPMIPETVTAVSESGIQTKKDAQLLMAHGFAGILVGESLLRQPDPGMALKYLAGGL
ncbi:MAG: hypothetical protein A2600_01695 [Candidatus Lambdaproteobacteria bacterium RIFOXYD1_FULL_56_27]|uniref:Indole-3-glycerol phosphate synthase n=1 Tax=Candidatus Lambdaproteobacteria bacterium RIFOXYD2_FULL_56_26 TaxID=1817773 RepID=A0A1F6GMU8_9PROT|nr:MAG: hypothetical protein A2557_12735 [Candidatus Lambdaproteobacteria bacterium RIFOXYD2_FULL_56_26]OGH05558.1 MAG: hypothetical protein A2426_04485 [Candidatus Lambdaproteobacteria bacterium RIFOXYC1_FULL_56_13]OGH08517.1 MAG: hypothetical protein A2600_01695 [Candidatus Lambdaproteobacteria bacterium RIFOXYD1_FULL_56_27]